MEGNQLRTPAQLRPPRNRTGGGTNAPEAGIRRREITAAVVQEADRLLAEGVDHATISARLGITEYVVRVMAGDTLRIGRPQPRQTSTRQAVNPRRSVGATTIRMVQRMLQASVLNRGQIAREAGVSRAIVEQVAKGQRKAIDTSRPVLCDGETFLPESVRCRCGAMISITPCRACRARRMAKAARMVP